MTEKQEQQETDVRQMTEVHNSIAAASETGTAQETEETETKEKPEDTEMSYPLSYYKEQQRQVKENTPPVFDGPNLVLDEIPQRKNPPSETTGISVRALTEAALMSAAGVVLGYLGFFFPLFAPLFLPLPIAFLTLRRGLKVGVLGTAVTCLLIGFLLGPFYAILTAVQMGCVGLFFGQCFRKKTGALPTLFGAILISAFVTACQLLLPIFIAGLSLTDLVASFQETIDYVINLWQEWGMLEQMTAGGSSAAEAADALASLVRLLLPGALIISSMTMTMLTYWLLAKVFRALGYQIKNVPKFYNWRLPWQCVWGVIVGALCCLFGLRFSGGEAAVKIGVNILYIYCPLLFLMGLSLCSWLAKAYRAPTITKALLVVMLIMFFPSSAVFLMLLGLFDPFLDLRARVKQAHTNRQPPKK